jgi:hypothetical protein
LAVAFRFWQSFPMRSMKRVYRKIGEEMPIQFAQAP